MATIKEVRKESLLPKGLPKYVRCYDNQGETIDCYTIVFSGNYKGRNRTCHYLSCNAHPFAPQGFGQHGENDTIIDKPSYKHLGKKVKFEGLPVDVKKFVLDNYNEMWELNK